MQQQRRQQQGDGGGGGGGGIPSAAGAAADGQEVLSQDWWELKENGELRGAPDGCGELHASGTAAGSANVLCGHAMLAAQDVLLSLVCMVDCMSAGKCGVPGTASRGLLP